MKLGKRDFKLPTEFYKDQIAGPLLQKIQDNKKMNQIDKDRMTKVVNETLAKYPPLMTIKQIAHFMKETRRALIDLDKPKEN
jgi:hypothetical protein